MARKASPRVSSKANWPTIRFGDVVRNVNDNVRDPLAAGLERYVGLEHLDPDSLHIKRWGLVAEGTTFTRKFTKGQVLFGKRRAYQRKAAVVEFDGVCSGDILVFEASGDELLHELLPFIVQSGGFFERAIGTSAGSLSPRTKWKDLATYEFALPPLDEQRHIAELLWAAEEAIERNYDAQVALEVCEETVISEVMKSVNSDRSSASDRVLSDLAEVSYGLTLNAARRSMAYSRPYLRVANVQRRKFDLQEVKTVGCTPEDVERFELRPNDVLVVEGHAIAAEIGRAALWEGQIVGCLHQNHILRIRCGQNLEPKFLVAFLNSQQGRLYFRQHAKSTSGLNTINSTVLKEIKVPCPIKDEQRRAVKMLGEFESSKMRMQDHLSSLREIKTKLGDSLWSDYHGR